MSDERDAQALAETNPGTQFVFESQWGEIVYLREADSSPSVRELSLLRDLRPAWDLVNRLVGDPAVDEALAEVRAGSRSTKDMAKRYARSHPPGREGVQRVFDAMLDGGTLNAFMCLATEPTFVIRQARPGDSVRSPQRRLSVTIERGVAAICHRGSGGCVRCGLPLVDQRPLDPVTGRRAWRDYCSACSNTSELWKDAEAIRVVLDAFSATTLTDARPRQVARRQRRTVDRQ